MPERMIDHISVIILTKNEELAIATALRSVEQFSDVFVVDSASTDRTVEIARSLGASVVCFDWNGQYPQKKQWSMVNAPLANDWVLFIDADERPSAQLVDELSDLKLGVEYGAFDIPISYIWRGARLRHGHRVLKRALVDRTKALFPDLGDIESGGIGEVEGHFQPKTECVVGRLTASMDHDDPDPFRQWISRHNRYSDWEAYIRSSPALYSAVRGARSRQGALFQRVPFKPVLFFLYAYIARLGFLDGRAGFDYAVANSVYYWMCSVKTRERVGDAAAGFETNPRSA